MDCCVKTWKTTTDYCLKTTIDATMPPVLGMLEFAASARQLEAATTRCRVPSRRPYQITNVTVTAAAMPAMSFDSAYCRAPPTISATKAMAIKAINPNITLRSGMMWLRYTSYVFAGLIYLNTFSHAETTLTPGPISQGVISHDIASALGP